MVACGALGGHVREIADRRGWRLELHCLPALLHNRPGKIAPQAERLVRGAQARGLRVAVAYADCGTYGALDELCTRLGVTRLPGLHCYDLLAGPSRMRALLHAEPGTYVLTDFLVRSFHRSVVAELGLDRHPELWPDYFGHYRRVVWLAQSRSTALDAEAASVAAQFGLPLTIIDTGTTRLERELDRLITTPTTTPAAKPANPAAAPATNPASHTSHADPASHTSHADPAGCAGRAGSAGTCSISAAVTTHIDQVFPASPGRGGGP